MNNTLKFGFILEYVTDIQAARQFYENVLGLKVEKSAPPGFNSLITLPLAAIIH